MPDYMMMWRNSLEKCGDPADRSRRVIQRQNRAMLAAAVRRWLVANGLTEEQFLSDDRVVARFVDAVRAGRV